MIKKLFVGLIALGVFIPCFSSAVNVRNDLGSYEDLGGNNNCTIFGDYSFDCSESNDIIIGTDTAWYKTSSSYFRTTSGLAVYIHQQNSNDSQGYVSSFLFCGENSNPLSSCNSSRIITYEEFISYKNSNNLVAWEWYSSSSTPGRAGPVFIYDNSYILVAPSFESNGIVIYQGGITPYDFGLVGYGLQANWSSVPSVVYPFPEPFPDTNVPDYSTDPDKITNQDAIDSYNTMGLTDEFCYGGFAMDNIFQSGETPSEFTGYIWGSGMFILDFWDIYSGAYSNDPVVFTRTFYQAYSDNNLSSFYGYSKGLYGYFNQYFNVSANGLGFWNSVLVRFTPIDIFNYCQLRFRGDPDAIYTGDNRDVEFVRKNKDLGSNEGKFNFSGNNNFFSGSLSGFDNPTDFFGSLNAIFQGGLGNIDYRKPLLPSYILLFLFAIILVRMLSH